MTQLDEAARRGQNAEAARQSVVDAQLKSDRGEAGRLDLAVPATSQPSIMAAPDAIAIQKK
jgi:hypothetical protein